MRLPKYLVVRLQDLRNGTIMDTTTFKKINVSKSGYPYPVILNVFKNNFETICYWLKHEKLSNGNGGNENKRVNYMMAIVENKINDEYLNWKRNKEITMKNETITVEQDTIDKIFNEEQYEIKNDKKDLSWVLNHFED